MADTQPSAASTPQVMTRTPIRQLAVIGILTAALLLSIPLWGGSDLMRTLVEFICFLALAQMWNLLAGYAGMVSVGQQAWIGLGGYALMVLADDLKINMFLAVFLGGLICAIIALPTAAILLRLRTGYFAIGTWVMAEVFHLLIASSTDWLRGGSGRTLLAAGLVEKSLREDLTYWLAAIVGIGAVLLVYLLMRSRLGLGLTAIRDSEGAAASLGVNTRRVKLMVYVICAFGAGVTGALYYLSVLRITPDASFSVQWSAYMIFIVVIGGIGTVEGPVVGTVIFFIIREYLSNFGGWSLILLGSVAVILMLVAPQGLWGLLQARARIELFPVRRRMEVKKVMGDPVSPVGSPGRGG